MLNQGTVLVMSETKLNIRRLTPLIGAEITGIDLADGLDDDIKRHGVPESEIHNLLALPRFSCRRAFLHEDR